MLLWRLLLVHATNNLLNDLTDHLKGLDNGQVQPPPKAAVGFACTACGGAVRCVKMRRL